MSVLTPLEAAKLANKVYDVKNEDDWNAISSLLGTTSQSVFAGFQSDPKRVAGKSGWGQTSGFSYLANGTGLRQGESLVAIRGTASFADAITDARMSFARSSSGHVVHRGFALAFESIKPDLSGYFFNRIPTKTHVVGHSLGGAMACLTAEYLSSIGHNVELYTFGCPRVGNSAFSHALDRTVGLNSIHRVYHEADPVSMIPIYPFTPVSNSMIGHQLPWNGGTVSFAAHKMENYISSIKDSSWGSLPKAQNYEFFSAADKWLEQVSSGAGSVKMLSCSALRQILRALDWILSSIGAAGAALAGFTLSGAAVVVDVLAYLLYEGVLAAEKMAFYIKAFLNAILKFLGREIQSGENVTVAFIKYILNIFFRTISSSAVRALSLFA